MLDGITDVDIPSRQRSRTNTRTNSGRKLVLQNGMQGERECEHEQERPAINGPSVDPPPPPLPPLPPPPPAHYYTDTSSASSESYYNQNQIQGQFPGVDPEAVNRYCAVFYSTAGGGQGFLGCSSLFFLASASSLLFPQGTRRMGYSCLLGCHMRRWVCLGKFSFDVHPRPSPFISASISFSHPSRVHLHVHLRSSFLSSFYPSPFLL